MAQHHEQTLPGLGTSGTVGATELTTGQHATGSGVTASDLTSLQLASGFKYAYVACHKRKDKVKGKVRNITMPIRNYSNEIKNHCNCNQCIAIHILFFNVRFLMLRMH